MNVSMVVAVFVVMVVGYFMLSLYRIQNKIFCTFRRPNKTKAEGWVSMKSKYVHFEGGRYNVNPKRITLLRWKRGIFQFFPIFVPSLDYSWDSPNPHDPETFRNTWDTPEARQAQRGEEAWTGFSRGAAKVAQKKSRFPEWFFPVITIGLIAMVGYLVYQMSGQLGYLQQAIQAIQAAP